MFPEMTAGVYSPAGSAKPVGAEQVRRSVPGALARFAAPSWPILCYWIAGLAIFGLSAHHFSGGHMLNQTSRDVWQHLAALRALIDDPLNPINPFIATLDGSRHFHPYWVVTATIAKAAGWNEFQAIALGGYLTAATLLIAIYAFAMSFFRNAWGPMALLSAMVLSWSLPLGHTGYHSVQTLIEGMAYPAVLLIALSLLLWALVIKSLERPSFTWLAIPLVAFMFATHPLGAGIGLIGAGCFILFWPGKNLQTRIHLSCAMGLGLLLSCAWPYFNPFALVVQTGNPTWTGGVDFYGPVRIFAVVFPSLIGIFGFVHGRYRANSRPLIAAFLIFSALFAAGYSGPLIATRFVMPAVLVLQIGVASLLLGWGSLPKATQLSLFGLGLLAITMQGILTFVSLNREYNAFAREGSAYEAAKILTSEIPDYEPVAAYDVAVWPLVSTGQRALSVPWPEPGIPDLDVRQRATERLFDPTLSRDERVALARRWGVRTLIMDRSGPLRRPMPPGLVATLRSQSVAMSRSNTLLRFDLM